MKNNYIKPDNPQKSPKHTLSSSEAKDKINKVFELWEKEKV